MLPKLYIDNYLELLKKRDCAIRIHGNGFIQIDASPLTRVHVWSRIIPRQNVYTGIHDHRFSFFSTVIYGDGLTNSIFLTEDRPKEVNETNKYSVYIARVRDKEDTVLENTGDVIDLATVVRLDKRINAGESYYMPARVFHESTLGEYQFCAISQMTKVIVDKQHSPRVLCPTSMTPDNDFNRNMFSPDFCWSLVRQIIESHEQQNTSSRR